MRSELDQVIARKGRHVALVVAIAMLAWLGGQWIAGAMGLPGRYAFLFDFAALAALIYAFVNIYQIWRLRQNTQGRKNQG
jgi:membrane protein implicated in regulation of membrane protease activity